jgi:hypothetical protein
MSCTGGCDNAWCGKYDFNYMCMWYFFRLINIKLSFKIYLLNLASGCYCFSCNFNTESKTCTGRCNWGDGSVIATCVNKKENPSSDTDCDCHHCGQSRDENGEIVCSGEPCGASGMTCKRGSMLFDFDEIVGCKCQY